MNIRRPVVAGQFYPNDKNELMDLLDQVKEREETSIDYSLAKNNIIGGIIPHAGYIFSSYQAMHFFQILKKNNQQYDTVFIINPSHTGMGNEISFDSHDEWETPLGKVEVDKDFAREMNIAVSEIEQEREHSGEVMVPFLQYIIDNPFKIAPVTMTLQNYRNAVSLANNIYEANQKLNKKILILASSDFSHFVDPETGKKLDQLVIDEILQFNTKQVEEVINRNNITVCGYGPIMALMEYSKLVDKNSQTKILKKGNSGDIIASNEVVDYVSMIFYHK
jgi:hypothetical protein